MAAFVFKAMDLAGAKATGEVDADSKQLLGAAILGVNGDEVVHALLDVMNAAQPYTVISRAMHIHPTVSELLPTLLQKLKPID